MSSFISMKCKWCSGIAIIRTIAFSIHLCSDCFCKFVEKKLRECLKAKHSLTALLVDTKRLEFFQSAGSAFSNILTVTSPVSYEDYYNTVISATSSESVLLDLFLEEIAAFVFYLLLSGRYSDLKLLGELIVRKTVLIPFSSFSSRELLLYFKLAKGVELQLEDIWSCVSKTFIDSVVFLNREFAGSMYRFIRGFEKNYRIFDNM